MFRVVLVLALASSSARAGGFEIPELGIRRNAMAAVIGRPDEPSALFHNPGGLVLMSSWRFYISLGGAIVHTSLQIAAWDQSDRFVGPPGPDGYYPAVTPSKAFAVIPMVAVTGPIRGKLYGGAAAFVGNASGAAFDAGAVTRYHIIDGYFIAPKAVIGAAYQLTPELAFGATAGVVNIRIHGHRDIYPIAQGMDITSITGSAPDLVLDGSGWAPTWSIGAFGRPAPNVTWGAAIIGRVDATLTGPVQITYSNDAPQPGDVLLGQSTTNQMLPWTFHAGVNVDVSPHLEVGTELRYWLYRQFQNMHTDVVGIFFVRAFDSEKDWQDSWQTSGGIRLHDLAAAPDLEVMAGLHYDRTPAPNRTLSFDTPTFSTWAIHTGVRYTLGTYRFGLGYELAVFRVPTITDSITFPPSNMRGTGNTHFVTLSFESGL
jgi:long-subunit fatty acid transport protein